MTIYGIEQSTDMRDKRTVIKKFSSESSALKWAENSGNLTHGEHAATQQNYHHTFRNVYLLTGRLPSKKEIESERNRWRHSVYSKTDSDVIAEYICFNGVSLPIKVQPKQEQFIDKDVCFMYLPTMKIH